MIVVGIPAGISIFIMTNEERVHVCYMHSVRALLQQKGINTPLFNGNMKRYVKIAPWQTIKENLDREALIGILEDQNGNSRVRNSTCSRSARSVFISIIVSVFHGREVQPLRSTLQSMSS